MVIKILIFMFLEKILKSTKEVVQQSKKVKIQTQKLKKLARYLKNKKIPTWKKKYHFLDKEKETLQYLFVLSSLNFCFFSEKKQKKWRVKFNNKKISGYFALAFALKKAIIKNSLLLKAKFLASISQNVLQKLLGGEGEIPLLAKRQEILNELGKVLLKNFGGQTINILEKIKRKTGNLKAENLIEILIKYFPSFRDIAFYKKREIYFLKRAQIFIGDIWGSFQGKSWGNFSDLHKLTCFADYKIPQILVNFGVLKYSPCLLKKIKRKEKIFPGSQEEIEIRANTIWAIEYLKKELKKLGKNFRSFEIDWILWNKAKKIKMKIPHHRTRTIYY